MKDRDLVSLLRRIGYEEGLPAVTDPGILDPREFLDTVLTVRFPNPFLPDSPQRIATDTSQKLSVRFGETIKTYNLRIWIWTVSGVSLWCWPDGSGTGWPWMMMAGPWS